MPHVGWVRSVICTDSKTPFLWYTKISTWLRHRSVLRNNQGYNVGSLFLWPQQASYGGGGEDEVILKKKSCASYLLRVIHSFLTLAASCLVALFGSSTTRPRTRITCALKGKIDEYGRFVSNSRQSSAIALVFGMCEIFEDSSSRKGITIESCDKTAATPLFSWKSALKALMAPHFSGSCKASSSNDTLDWALVTADKIISK